MFACLYKNKTVGGIIINVIHFTLFYYTVPTYPTFSAFLKIMNKKTDYAALKQKLSEFLSGFTTVDDNGRKRFKYAEQLTNLAHR